MWVKLGSVPDVSYVASNSACYFSNVVHWSVWTVVMVSDTMLKASSLDISYFIFLTVLI